MEEREPEKCFEEEEPNYLDLVFQESDVGEATTGPCVTLTMKNGLIVRHLPNGDIVQLLEHSLEDRKAHSEIDRVFTNKGTVIRHFANLDCQVLYPSGEVANFHRESMKWTTTNDKGYRREFQDGVYKQLSKINCLSQTDSKTGIVTKIREDNVVLIKYPDGNTYCQHADGTQIFCQKGSVQIRIEKEGFAPVMHQQTTECADEEEWWETTELKSTSGMMSQVDLPDGATVKTIMFQKSKQIQEPIMRHIIQR